MKKGITIPIQAKMIWNPRERAICERAAKKSSILVSNQERNILPTKLMILKSINQKK